MIHGTKEGEVSSPQRWGEIVRRFFFRLEKIWLEGMGRGWIGGGVDLRCSGKEWRTE